MGTWIYNGYRDLSRVQGFIMGTGIYHGYRDL